MKKQLATLGSILLLLATVACTPSNPLDRDVEASSVDGYLQKAAAAAQEAGAPFTLELEEALAIALLEQALTDRTMLSESPRSVLKTWISRMEDDNDDLKEVLVGDRDLGNADFQLNKVQLQSKRAVFGNQYRFGFEFTPTDSYKPQYQYSVAMVFTDGARKEWVGRNFSSEEGFFVFRNDESWQTKFKSDKTLVVQETFSELSNLGTIFSAMNPKDLVSSVFVLEVRDAEGKVLKKYDPETMTSIAANDQSIAEFKKVMKDYDEIVSRKG